MIEKIWYIKINEIEEGPYSVQDLKHDTRITLDTLVWKEGFPAWIPIRYVFELKEVFEDLPASGPEENEDECQILTDKEPTSELVLESPFSMPPGFLLLLIIAIALLFILLQIFEQDPFL